MCIRDSTSAAYSIANNAGAKAIITFSVSGKTTLRMARERAPVQIIGLSPNIKTARKMQIAWGVNSCHSTQDAANTTEMVNIACSVVKNKNLVDQNIEFQKFKIIDARSKERFLGLVPEPRQGLKSGHIEGSKNIPFQLLLNEDRTFKKK